MSHTQGKLRVGAKCKADIYPDIGRPVLFATTFHQDGKEKANARRLVACWNACEGVSTSFLELLANLPVNQVKVYENLETQRNELLEALKTIVGNDFLPGAWSQKYEIIASDARAAIAKAEGKA